MALTYPVDLEARYDLWDTDTNAMATREKDGVVSDVVNIKWPRADGMEIVGKPANYIPLLRVKGADPTFDPATQRLGPVGEPVVDLTAQTSTYTRSVVDLSPEEIQARADAAADEVLRQAARDAYDTLGAGITAIQNGTGDTAAQRLARLENGVITLATVCRRLIKDNYA